MIGPCGAGPKGPLSCELEGVKDGDKNQEDFRPARKIKRKEGEEKKKKEVAWMMSRGEMKPKERRKSLNKWRTRVPSRHFYVL